MLEVVWQIEKKQMLTQAVFSGCVDVVVTDNGLGKASTPLLCALSKMFAAARTIDTEPSALVEPNLYTAQVLLLKRIIEPQSDWWVLGGRMQVRSILAHSTMQFIDGIPLSMAAPMLRSSSLA